jgi:hypothetical protein
MRMKEIFRSLLAFFIPLIFSANAFALPVTWSVNGHTYDVGILPGADWNTARTSAQGLGAGWDLATINSAGEQGFINSLLGPPPGSGVVQYWVGGFQPPGSAEPGGNWQWINGEGLFWNNGPILGVYSNWGSGVSTPEPNNDNNLTPDVQNHVALDNRYGWGWDDNDNYPNVISGYVAERVPEPSTMTMLLLGSGLVGLAAYRRKRQS